jgi:hypothetical protein
MACVASMETRVEDKKRRAWKGRAGRGGKAEWGLRSFPSCDGSCKEEEPPSFGPATSSELSSRGGFGRPILYPVFRMELLCTTAGQSSFFSLVRPDQLGNWGIRWPFRRLRTPHRAAAQLHRRSLLSSKLPRKRLGPPTRGAKGSWIFLP